jgi:hypothetical protein
MRFGMYVYFFKYYYGWFDLFRTIIDMIVSNKIKMPKWLLQLFEIITAVIIYMFYKYFYMIRAPGN